MDFLFTGLHHFFAFIVILTIIVFIHEFGHYIVAKLFGVKIEEFAIGFGKELFGWNDKSGTRWKFCLFPVGGYVKNFGDEDPSSSKVDIKKLKKLTEKEKKQTFYYQSVYKRMAIVFAGPLFNFLLAILILTASYRINGITYFKPIISKVIEYSAAHEAGIKEGDLIISINDEFIDTFEEVQKAIALNTDQELEFGIIRNYILYDIKMTPKLQKTKDIFGNEITANVAGIGASDMVYKKANLFTAFVKANTTTYDLCKNTLKALGQMITGKRSAKELGGPLKIAKYSGQSFEGGFAMVMWFIAMISANLGLVNLLPIPILDGGAILFFIIEAIRKKPLSEKTQDKLFKIGFGILIALMAFAVVNDFIQVFIK